MRSTWKVIVIIISTAIPLSAQDFIVELPRPGVYRVVAEHSSEEDRMVPTPRMNIYTLTPFGEIEINGGNEFLKVIWDYHDMELHDVEFTDSGVSWRSRYRNRIVQNDFSYLAEDDLYIWRKYDIPGEESDSGILHAYMLEIEEMW